MTVFLRRFSVVFLLLFVGLFEAITPAYASESLQGRPANLTIDPLQPLVIGDHPTITVHLLAEFGQPIPNQPIIIFVDGARKAAGKTDSRGIASIVLKYKFAAGTYRVQAVYPGIIKIGLPRTVAEVQMAVQPAKVAIYTVPPVARAKFKLNNQIYTADENGVVNLELGLSGMYTLEALPLDPNQMPPNTRWEFARWNDNVFTAKRQVYFPRNRPLQAGFTLNYKVNQRFYDSTNQPVDPARISSMMIRAVGTTYTFDAAGPIWLPANRLTRRIGESLQSEELVYYVRDITIDGTNVINKSEQRFQIRPNDVWPIQVLLYSIRVSGRDAMFHFPVGKGIELTYPDGHKKVFLFNSSNAEVVIPSLARGSYSARIIGAWGSAPPTPIYLSRDQDTELLMLSALDIALIVGLPLSVALLFFFIGRPKWFHVLRHPSRYKELVYQNTNRDTSL